MVVHVTTNKIRFIAFVGISARKLGQDSDMILELHMGPIIHPSGIDALTSMNRMHYNIEGFICWASIVLHSWGFVFSCHFLRM